jgi:hypothetical protein
VARHNIHWAEKFQVFPVRGAWVEDPKKYLQEDGSGLRSVRDSGRGPTRTKGDVREAPLSEAERTSHEVQRGL